MKPNPQDPAYFHSDDCCIDEFARIVSASTEANELQFAERVDHSIPTYDIPSLTSTLQETASRSALMAEWAEVLLSRAGAIVLKAAYADTSVLDAATDMFNDMISKEKALKDDAADHFAKAGKNDRIWNTQQKLCEHSPEIYMEYYANPAIHAACEAWLGPGYQMTAQVNLVHPGGAAQEAHRDYHLGFQSADEAARYPAHAHLLSATLTLQGAIVHIDMPIESGPTKLLPYSQSYAPGYAAYRRPEFREFFEKHYVQLPLKKGDVVFFNPAIFHAAGSNTTEATERMANLLQVSSAFGRSLENLDRIRMCKKLYPTLKKAMDESAFTTMELDAIIAATAEGYSFPTNLDSDPPTGGLAPETQNALFHRALGENWNSEKFFELLDQQSKKKLP